jgi:hypothetical protein
VNKARERRAFDRTYGPRNTWNVVPGEVPDFLCERSGRVLLGVEVTQIWLHETDARLANIKGYTSTLLDKGTFLHKDDSANVVIDDIKIVPVEGDAPTIEVRAIFQELPKSAEKVEFLLSAIDQKTEKSSAYLAKCPQIDLVIEDASTIFWFDDFEKFLRPISASPRRATLLASPFREIFLLTRNGSTRSRVCIPLKASLLLEDLLVLEELLDSRGDTPPSDDDPSRLHIVCSALQRRGHVDLPTCIEDSSIGLVIGSYTVHWTPKGKVVRDYCSWPGSPHLTGTISSVELSASESDIAGIIAKQTNNYRVSVPLIRRFEDVELSD